MKASDLNHLFMQAPVAICIVSGPQYIVEMVNERMLQFLGRTDSIVGYPLQQTLTEASEQGLMAILENVRQTKKPYYVSDFPGVFLINGIRELRYFNLTFKPYFLNAGEETPTGIFCVAHNVTEAVLTTQKLEEEKRHTTLALETGGLGMLATDWKANSATPNKRALEIFGLEGSPPFDAYLNRIHSDDKKIREQAIEKGRETGNFDFEVRLVFENNEIRWMRSRGLFNFSAEGHITGTFGVIQDVTPQKKFVEALRTKVEQRTAELAIANNTLQQLNENLLRTNANLEEFARAASHDLKEPVRKMQVFASRLKDTLANRFNADELEMFLRMENAASRMGLLVDDLLDYSRLVHTPQQAEEINLNDKMTQILSDLELLVTEKKATVVINELPLVTGHRLQLQQLFQNLLSNALKYSRPGVPPHVTVTASVINSENKDMDLPPTAAGKQFHFIQVKDNGIGFNPADAEKIFTVFTRLHGKAEYAGTGLGLSIAKKVVENHGGYIWATGKPGEGSSFNVLLPVKDDDS